MKGYISALSGDDLEIIESIVLELLTLLVRCRPNGKPFCQHEGRVRLQVTHQPDGSLLFMIYFPLSDGIYNKDTIRSIKEAADRGNTAWAHVGSMEGVSVLTLRNIVLTRIEQILIMTQNGKLRIPSDARELSGAPEGKIYIWDLVPAE